MDATASPKAKHTIERVSTAFETKDAIESARNRAQEKLCVRTLPARWPSKKRAPASAERGGGNTIHTAPSSMPLVAQPTAAERAMLMTAVRSPDTRVRIVKVKQPWATALVRGIKDCENRTWYLPDAEMSWVLVAASKSKPTKAMLTDLYARVARHGGSKAQATQLVAEAPRWPRGMIVGAVRLRGCFREDALPHSTPWHNPPDFGWVVDRAVDFASPALLDANDGMQTQVKLVHRPQYVERVADCIRAFE